ncbi:MAG TPA: TOBE domain-containing protein, partial [Bacillales bacterium]|nr:TOBE domain-containing protein [Bacillales bacterium]
LNIDGQEVLVPNHDDFRMNEKVYMSVRPERAKIVAEGQNEAFNVSVTLKEKVYVGTTTKIVMAMPNGKEMVIHDAEESEEEWKKDHPLLVSWKPEHSVVFQQEESS